MADMRILLRAASSSGKVKHGSSYVRMHREVAVVLCKGNHAIFPAVVQL
jgi:hypothetical protein